MPNTRRRYVALAAVLLATTVAGGLLAAQATTPRHDDAISMLAASANLGTWAELEDEPVGVRDAATWQQLTQPRGPKLTSVAADIGSRDLHPPVYFIVLSLWRWLAGSSMTAALALNVLLLLGTVVVVDRLAAALALDRVPRALAALATGVSPAMLWTALEVRPYVLAALLSSAFAWSSLALRRDPGPGRAAIAVVLGATLVLTHYSGVWIVGGLGVAGLIGPARRWLIGASAGAAMLAIVVFPAVLDQLTRQSAQQVTALGTVDLVARLRQVIAATGSSLLLDRPGVLLAAVTLLIVGGVAVVAWRAEHPERAWLARSTLIASAGIVGFYLLGRAPTFAMASKYLAFVWPLVWIAVAAALPPGRLIAAVAALTLVGSTVWSWQPLVHRLADAPIAALSDADAVVVDTVARGIVPVALWHVDPSAATVVGSQTSLVDAAVLDDMRGCRLLVITSLRRGDAGTSQLIVDRLTAGGWSFEPVEPSPIENGSARSGERDC